MAGKHGDKAQAPRAGSPSEDEVKAYLTAHPDFLARHSELVMKLVPPSRPRGDNVVDLQQFFIERLKAEVDDLRGCAEHLITTTRNNMSTQARTHEAALAVLAARNMADLAEVVADDLPPLLDVDVVTICFETGDQPVPELVVAGIQLLPAGRVDELLAQGHSVLRGNTTGDPAVFADGAGLVRSYAMVRLDGCGRCPAGLVALGSRNERTFHHSQAIDLLNFLARIIENAVRRWVGH